MAGLCVAATLAGIPGADLGPDDEAFLEELEQRSFLFFWEQAHEQTGLIADRAPADGSRKATIGSMASVGFGLSGLCIAQQRGWLTHEQAYSRALATLRHLWEKQPHEHGFFYHFVDMKTGARDKDCELSSIDTALLMAGVLTVGQFYQGTEVAELAQKVYERVDWPWMLAGGQTLSMGWTPEKGFLTARWDNFSEHPVMYVLGMASPTHPLEPGVWNQWKRQPVVEYAGRRFMQCPPLFTHQYSHAWVDFRDRRDAWADYFRNSVQATLAHRQFCMDLGRTVGKYSQNLWGITSSDAPQGYKAWGGPPATTYAPIDGTVVPCAAAGSLPFAPRECVAALRHMKDTYGDRIWKKYGFADAFNPATGWVGPDVIGIDVGITLVMAENARTGLVRDLFMKNPRIDAAMRAAGFRSTNLVVADADREYLRGIAKDTWRCIDSLVESGSGLPRDKTGGNQWTSVSNIGLYLTSVAAARELGLIDAKEASRRVGQALSSLAKCRTWFGFQQTWNSVETLEPATHDPWVSILDSGNLAAGLIAVGQAMPEHAEVCRKLVDAMQWRAFYDGKKGLLLGGYNTLTQKFNPDWHLPDLGSDSRLAQLLAVAQGQAPVRSWELLNRHVEERYGTSYYVPGWQGGGLFMHYISGLWVDERDTAMGQSARNFAYAQMMHAASKGLPVWGWSASDSPDGQYLGWGKIQDQVVTPHACVLALSDYPREVVANLRVLEKMGARHAELGFYDSIDLSSGKVTGNFLLLDQAMLFLSLANYLQDDVIHRWVQADPLVQRGRELIDDYRQPAYGKETSLFDLPGSKAQVPAGEIKQASARPFDGWKEAQWQTLAAPENLETGQVSTDNQVSARFALAWDQQSLHFAAHVQDGSVRNSQEPARIYEEDCVELFIDPQNDGLRWGDARDFQFGFAAVDKSWEWFGKGRAIEAKVQPAEDGQGYRVEAAIPWSVLGVKPSAGMTLGVSAAVKSVGSAGGAMKLNWCWRPGAERVELGRITLRD